MSETNENTNDDQRFVGLLAQFEDPKSLVAACDQARQAGYKKMDAYSPFPIHGIDPAIGIKRTILPFIVLAIGLGACGVGLALQYYTNNDVSTFGMFPGYEFKISGKPYFSLPANIPVTFEIIVCVERVRHIPRNVGAEWFAEIGKPSSSNFSLQASHQRQVLLDDRRCRSRV